MNAAQRCLPARLTTSIRFWIGICPILWRYAFGRWYVFNEAPAWIVELAAAKGTSLMNRTCIPLWNEAAKERDMRIQQRPEDAWRQDRPGKNDLLEIPFACEPMLEDGYDATFYLKPD